VIPGVTAEAVHQFFLSPTALGELWGRPMAAVRYEVEAGEWLGRRGLSHHTGWPNLHAVGEWTYPGRLVSDVVEGAMRVADTIIGATTP
jgi:phytoene dehydrogenase-like protein